MSAITNATFVLIRLSLGTVGAFMTLLVLSPRLFGINSWDDWDTHRSVALLIGLNLLLTALLLSSRRLQRWFMEGFVRRMLSPMELILLLLARVGLAVAGVSITLIVLLADWLGLDPTPGFGRTRLLQLSAGLLLLLATYLLHSKPLRRWITDTFGLQILGSAQVFILSVTRIVLVAAGLVTLFLLVGGEWIGIGYRACWGAPETVQLVVGISLIIAAFLLQNRPMQRWFIRHLGYRLLSPGQIALLLVLQVLVGVAGLTVTFLVLFADHLGIDPTPGWGTPRLMQLVGGLALLAASFVLYSRSLPQWVQRRAARSNPPPKA